MKFIEDILLTVWIGVIFFLSISGIIVVFFCARYLFYYSTDGQMKVKTYTDWGLLESEIVFVENN